MIGMPIISLSCLVPYDPPIESRLGIESGDLGNGTVKNVFIGRSREGRMRLRDKVTLVTGGGRGNGRAIALGLTREGAKVVVGDIVQTSAEATAQEIKEKGGQSLGIYLDVRHQPSVEKAVERTIAQFGRLDVLVNNAGILRRIDFLDMTEADWDETIDVNLKGVFLCSLAAARRMANSGGGSIVNISSLAVERTRGNQVAYSAGKGGVTAMTKAMAIALAPYGVRVNAIAPGTIRTEMTRSRWEDPEVLKEVEAGIPIGRIGEPEDLVGAVIYFASDVSAYATGSVLFIDGGRFPQSV